MNLQEHEHEFKTVRALARAACGPFVTDEDIDILCGHAGKRRDDIKGIKVTGYSVMELKAKAKELMRQTELAIERMEERDEA